MHLAGLGRVGQPAGPGPLCPFVFDRSPEPGQADRPIGSARGDSLTSYPAVAPAPTWPRARADRRSAYRCTPQVARTSKIAPSADTNRAGLPKTSIAAPAPAGPTTLPRQLNIRKRALPRARAEGGSRSPRRVTPSG